MRQKHHRTSKQTKLSKSFIFTPRNPSRDDLCSFPFSDGRTCRMPRWNKHRTLCIYHARSEQQLLAADQAARQLVSLSGDFRTASDINHVLGKLFSLVAQNRIPRRDAVALAYIGQLLLQSLPEVRNEIRNTLGYRAWNATVHDALGDQASASHETDGGSADGADDDSAGESSEASA
jgi:hypothetical protein